MSSELLDTANYSSFQQAESDLNNAIKKLRKRHNKKSREKTNRIEMCVEHVEEKDESITSFNNFGFDECLLKSIGDMGWSRPTFIQQNMIPLILENKCVIARARTGSGKTAAFLLPLIHKVLLLKSQLNSNASECHDGPYSIFISPTKELCDQTYETLRKLASAYPFLNSMNLAHFDEDVDEYDFLKESLDMITSTPGRLLSVLQKFPRLCENAKHIVFDEADLVLSYGYEEDIRKIKKFLPHQMQAVFTSATMNDDINILKGLFTSVHVVVLRLKESQLPSTDQLTQYHISCQSDEERFAILISLFKLKLIVGKCIIFVSNTTRCYKLGLFLQVFKIRSCILNAEMPLNSRSNVIKEFNDGKYNIIVTSDLNDIDSKVASTSCVKEVRKKIAKTEKYVDKESGVTRGIDFHHVSNVINFDFPPSTDLYIHRVGRTARGWNKGTALSFATPNEQGYLEQVQRDIDCQLGGKALLPYEIRMKELEPFLLRSRDVLTACTSAVIKESRLAEIRAEILRSKRLEMYFIKNPREKSLLEHDKKLHKMSLPTSAIANVPDYIVPESLRGRAVDAVRIVKSKKRLNSSKKQRVTYNQRRFKSKENDPLQIFSV